MIRSVDITGADEVKAALKKLGGGAPHAIRLAVSELGESGQRAIRASLPKHFQQRGTREGFDRAVVWQAPRTRTRGNVEGILRVGSDGVGATATKKLGVLLARHESGGTRTSNARYRMGSDVNRGQTFEGGFFIPAKGLRTGSANPPRSLYPTAIGAQMRRGDGAFSNGQYFAKSRRKTRKSKGQMVRGESFYVVPSVGIFRRRASVFGASEGEPIWWFNRTVRTPPRLGMWATVEAMQARIGTDVLNRAIDTVIRRSA